MRIATLCASVLCLSLTGCGYVGPGYVGVKVNLYGTNRGVDNMTIVTGRVWYNPMTTEIHEFPVFMQNLVWTKDATEGSPNDESISFNSKEGAALNVDVGVSYQFRPESVTHVFNELRKDADDISRHYLRTKVRDVLNRHSVNYTAVEIYSDGKNQLLTDVKTDLDSLLGKHFVFDTVTFVGKVRGDASVEQSINRTIQATQMAIEAENKVRQIEAEAKQKIAEAQGKAKSILAVAEAEAQANTLITESLSPQLMNYKAIEKWDGIMPKVTGDTVPFIQIQE